VAGGRPIQPRATYNVHVPDTIIHGALMLGGTFTDVTNFNPYVSQVLTDEQYIQDEPLFDVDYWYPVGVGTINRFLNLDGQSDEQLVVVPGQFKANANSNPTRGSERLYSDLQFEIFHGTEDNSDFEPPHIWHVAAQRAAGHQVQFSIAVGDDIGATPRVVVLYRELPSTTWQKVELTYDPTQQRATGIVPAAAETMAYFVQAVDSNGNVTLALNHGNEWLLTGGPTTGPTPTPTATAVPPVNHSNYLPVLRKDN
jgi:hypothetical protein